MAGYYQTGPWQRCAVTLVTGCIIDFILYSHIFTIPICMNKEPDLNFPWTCTCTSLEFPGPRWNLGLPWISKDLNGIPGPEICQLLISIFCTHITISSANRNLPRKKKLHAALGRNKRRNLKRSRSD